MSDKPALTARMLPDTYERVMDYCEEHGLSKSDAARRLVEAGLESQEETKNLDLATALTAGVLSGVLAIAYLEYGVHGALLTVTGVVLGFGSTLLAKRKPSLTGVRG